MKSPVVTTFGNTSEAAQWLSDQTETWLDDGCVTFHVEDEHGFCTVVALHNNFGHDIELSVWVRDGYALTRRELATPFRWAFTTLGVHRMTVRAKASNARALSIQERCGFQREGLVRQGSPDRDDIVLMGLLKEECIWLKRGDPRDGRQQQTGTVVSGDAERRRL